METQCSTDDCDGALGVEATKRARRRLRRGAVEAFALQGAGAGLLFVMHTEISRSIGPTAYGVFSFATSVAAVAAGLVPLGWPTALMRYIAEYADAGAWALLRGVMTRAFQVTAVMAVVAATLLWVISFSVPMTPDRSLAMRYGALLLLPVAFVGLRRKSLQGLQRVRESIIPDQVLLPVLASVLVISIRPHSAAPALAIYFVGTLAAFAIGSTWLVRSLPVAARSAPPEYRTRAWMGVALPMVFGTFSQLIIARADVVLLGALSNMHQVGLYSAAVRYATLVAFPLGAVNMMAAPMMAAAYNNNRHGEFQMVLWSAVGWSTLGAVPLAMMMFFMPTYLLGLFGPGFEAGAPILRILAIGQLVNGLTGPSGFALLMTGRQRAFAVITAAVAVLTGVAGYLVIPRWGGLGAAMVTSGCVAVLNGSMLVWTLLYVVRSSNSKPRVLAHP